ncbi:MAG: GAF domain-containing protein, partial [Deltaproteobacteria bacterium]|nr:GAF domain-containing protein [Deltaproteobacteria bacterium]
MIRLEVVQGQDKGLAHETEEVQILLGRAANATFQLSDHHLSGEHGLIFRDQDHYVYRDLRSTNGSMLLRGQKRVLLDGSDRWETTLRDGDRLLLGDATSPVIVLCKVQVEQSEEREPRLIARRERDEFETVAGKVEQGPDMPGLYQALKAFGSGLELDAVLDAVATAVFELISRATHLSILLVDGDDQDRFTPVLARSREGTEGTDPVLMSRSVLRRVLAERAAVLAADAVEHLGSSESLMAAKIRSTIGVPLWRGDQIIGVIEIDNRASAGMFAERDLDLLLVLGQQAALAIDNARLYSRLQLAQERVEG